MKNELVQKIETLKNGEATLRAEIEKYLASKRAVINGFNPSSLSLQHQIYERPVGWICVHENGRVVLQSGKGYINFLDSVSMYDIETILKYIDGLSKEIVMIPNDNGKVSVSFDKKTLSTEVGYYPQHLYLLSDEEVQSGDWFYCSDKTNYRHIFKCVGDSGAHLKVKNAKEAGCYFIADNIDGYGDWAKCYSKKIIATTDASLGLPAIPKSDIEKYVSEWEAHKLVTV